MDATVALRPVEILPEYNLEALGRCYGKTLVLVCQKKEGIPLSGSLMEINRYAIAFTCLPVDEGEVPVIKLRPHPFRQCAKDT